MKKKLIFGIVIIFCTISSFSQIIVSTYNTGNSPIPNNKVSKVIEDNQGNIWASTDGGIAKFDGLTWTIWDSTNTGISLNYAFGIAYDKVNEFIWITKPGYLLKFDGITWQHWNIIQYAYDITIDNFGNVWQVHYDKGISRFDGVNFTYYDTTNSSLPNNLNWTIEVSPSNDIWITSAYGLSRFDGANWTIYNSGNTPMPNNYFTGISFESNGDAWLHGSTSNYGYLFHFNGTTWVEYDSTICSPPSDHSIIVLDGFNRKWVGSTSEGITLLGDTSCAYYTTGNTSLPSNSIVDMILTNNNVIWGATWFDGLFKFEIPVGLSEYVFSPKFIISPNPTSSSFNISIEIDRIHIVRIFDTLGKRVFLLSDVNQSGVDINIENLKSGIYLVQIVNSKGDFAYQKLIKN